MRVLHPDAVELNDILARDAPDIFHLLSERGVRTFFTKQSILTQAEEAAGTAINATVGIALEDDGSLMVLPEMVLEGMDRKWLDYAPAAGVERFRQAWQSHILKNNPLVSGLGITLPIAVGGLVHGLSVLGELFLDESDKLLIPNPFWGPYKNIFYQANIEPFPAFDENGFSVSALEKALQGSEDKKVAVLLNFPNNPTGYSPTHDEAFGIIDVIRGAAEKGASIVAICDDAYFGLDYHPGVYPHSMFNLLSSLDMRVLAVKVDGLTKELYAWGARVAAVTYGFQGMTQAAAGALEKKTEGMVRDTISRANTLWQEMAATVLGSDSFQKSKWGNYRKLEDRYTAVKATLEAHREYAECFTALPFNSGYFMCARLRPGLDANEVRMRLLSDFDTGVVTAGKDLIRIAFSSVPARDIERLFENIYQACLEAR